MDKYYIKSTVKALTWMISKTAIKIKALVNNYVYMNYTTYSRITLERGPSYNDCAYGAAVSEVKYALEVIFTTDTLYPPLRATYGVSFWGFGWKLTAL